VTGARDMHSDAAKARRTDTPSTRTPTAVEHENEDSPMSRSLSRTGSLVQVTHEELVRASFVSPTATPAFLKQKRPAVTATYRNKGVFKAVTYHLLNVADNSILNSKGAEVRLMQILAQSGGGSSLRGWRRQLDPFGILEVPFTDFKDACIKLGFARDAQELFAGLRHTEVKGMVSLEADHAGLLRVA